MSIPVSVHDQFCSLKLSSNFSERQTFQQKLQLISESYMLAYTRHSVAVGILTPSRITVQQIVEFFIFFQRQKQLVVPSINWYQSTLNHVFLFLGTNLTKNSSLTCFQAYKDRLHIRAQTTSVKYFSGPEES